MLPHGQRPAYHSPQTNTSIAEKTPLGLANKQDSGPQGKLTPTLAANHLKETHNAHRTKGD
jgi:hypothetical protein